MGPKQLTPYTFQPALNFDPPPAPVGYFPSISYADALAGSSSTFLLQKVTYDAQGVPALSNPIQIPVENYVEPEAVGALGTPDSHIILPAASFRFGSCTYL